MIVRTPGGHRAELYAFDSSTPIPRPSQWGGALSVAGERVTFESAVGLSAFLRGVRLISETGASLPLDVYRGYKPDKEIVRDAPQLPLLRQPNPDQTAFNVWAYVFVSMLRGNAYLWKIKTKQEGLKQLYPINPAFVTPKYEGNTVKFELRDQEYGVVKKTVTRSEIIHIPGILLENPYVGVSIIEAQRNGIGLELKRSRFESRYLANNGAPGTVLKNPGNPTAEQRAELRAGYEAMHSGDNVGRPGMVWGGWDIATLPVALKDAQFIEAKKFSVQDIGRMLGIPAGLLGDPDAPGSDSPEQEDMRLLQHGVRPWMTRLEQALSADTDLFQIPDHCVEFDEQGFLRADIKTRYDAYRLGRQGGWVTANEIRSLEGLSAVEGGDEIQQTPVGGAANASQAGGATDGSQS